ncbi:tetratricopeptide repeat protein 27-like [Coccinella septempunctata]|uniref:tetratricopeptide repeat protein 27-like n=1 Tax=Coccinella septempunctata TaxID=41139 RepID=UPI001D08F62F|nr:tetratricopeptide repeat protein 27-like [Coccinella septempunctata]
MGGSDVLEEYFFFIENNKEIEDGNYPEASELMCRIRDTDIWNHFIERSFDNIDLQEYFTSLSSEVRSKIFKFGISCFVHFVQANFTGPDLGTDVIEIFNNPKIEAIDFPKFLTLNNEEINVNTKHPILLVVSKCIFEKCLVSNIVNSLWTWRSMIVHQQIMEELSPLLLSQADALKKQITTFNLQGYEKAKFDIEFAQLYLTFRHVAKAKEHIYSADDILGVQYSLQGKLTKRTKHHEKDIAQLTLEISLSSDNSEIKRPLVLDFEIPKNVKAEKTSSEPSSKANSNIKVISIPNTEQKLFLTRAHEMLVAKPQDDLQIDEIRPFIDLILNQKNTWAVRVATLLLRCKIEVKFGKVVEKTLAQCREILDCYDRPKPHVLTRFADVFSTGLVPMWKVEIQCADVLMNLGLIKHALDVYKKVQHWEQVIACYNRLKSKQKGIEAIKSQLEKKETVKMLCLLGDATDDVSCYEKAWELSKKRSHRAQRQWGHFFYSRKQYAECIPHYEKSVSINPLQSQVWLRLGYAAQQNENWHVAATAYRRYTNLEPDGFQAWNNLAQAYIKINNKRSAQNALLEALKYNYENWKIWENLLLVSTDTYSYANIIKSYHKVLDLKGKYLNLEALNVLVFNVCNDISDEHKRAELRLHDEPENLMQKCRELLGRVISIYPGEGYIWELYASLVPPSLLRAQRFQRAYRAYTQTGWDKSPQTCVQVMCLCIKLAELVLTKGVDLQDHLLNSVKLNLSSAVSATRKHDWEESRSLVDEVSVHLDRLVEKVRKLTEKSNEINNGERLVLL